MLGTPLDVEQRQPCVPHPPDEKHERDLGGIPLRVEHRLAYKQAVDAHAVETTGQLPRAIENLDAVRPPELVQPDVRVDELRRDPAALARGVRARADDVGK